MARGRKPKLTVVGGESAGPGHNSEMTDEQRLRLLRGHMDKVTGLKTKIASLTGELRSTYKTAKGDGIPKWEIDFALDLEKDEDDKMLERRRRETELARLLNHPIGTQFDMFDSDPRPLVERATEEGKQAGLKGKDCSPPHAPNTEAYEGWVSGWHQGQSVLAGKFQQGPKPDAELLRDADAKEDSGVDEFDAAASE